MTRTRVGLAMIGAAWAALVCGCREPVAVSTATAFRAASADSNHVEIGFPEALDPVAMADTTNYSIEMVAHGGAAPVRYAVRRAAVCDTLRGRCVRLETSTVPDGVSLRIRMRSVRLLTGPTLARDVELDMVSGLAWGKDVGPLFVSACNSCHSGVSPAGEYPTDSYFGIWGNGTSPPANVSPGDSTSLVVVKTRPGASMFTQADLEFIESDIIRNWITFYQARP